MATVKKVTIQANVAWSVTRSASSDRWIAICDELNLTTEADSEEELQSLIPETLHLLMADLLEDDELAQYLHEKGWSAVGLPSSHEADDIMFDLPWHIISGSQHDPERRLN